MTDTSKFSCAFIFVGPVLREQRTQIFEPTGLLNSLGMKSGVRECLRGEIRLKVLIIKLLHGNLATNTEKKLYEM